MLEAVRPTILVVDDEPEILRFLHDNLRDDGYSVTIAASVAQARSKLNAIEPAVILLDVGLPDGNGFDLCTDIRDADPMVARWDPEVPIIMLTARCDDVDRVRGFQRGADDFVPKPFHYPELLARVEVQVRRHRPTMHRETLQVAGISIDLVTREVRVDGDVVDLSAKEFQLLATLAREPRRVHRKQDLLADVWGFQSSGTTRTLDSHASRLRRKLRAVCTDRSYVDNVWGVGYRLIALEGCA